MHQFDKVTAIFDPSVLDDLADDMHQYIGQQFIFEALFRIEDGPYKDQWAMQAWDGPIRWAPECDLKIVAPGGAGGVECNCCRSLRF